ncbi:MAG: hypothetical protein U0457_12730 [Candidatus Sericytochromatia bacterium]
MQIKYKITTLAPVLIASDSGEINTVNTHKYINGNTILGVFASKYIKKEKLKEAHQNDIFKKWFLDGNLKFSNAYILSNSESPVINYPIPFSVQQEKGGENIFDLLLDDGSFEDEEKQTKSISKFGNIKNKDISFEPIKQNINFHHAIEEKQIFHYESISEKQVFQGEILGDKKDLDDFFKFFEKKFCAFIGRSKTAQYGKVNIELETKDSSELKLGNEINLTLISDAIIYNKNAYSSTNIDDLQNYLGNDIKIIRAFIKTSITENFVSIWKMKKPSENIFLAGSCFTLDILNNNGKKQIESLYNIGLGERTNEGFGRFLVDYQNEFELLEIKKKINDIKKPKNQIPKISKDIMIYAIQKIILEKLSVYAIFDMKDFLKTPNKSLLGRLKLMVNTSYDESIFKDKIKNLRKTAKDQLQRCNNKNKTLEEFFSTISIESKFKKIIAELSKLEPLLKDIKYNPSEDTNLIQKAFKTYFNSFFTSMIKNKKDDKNDE